MSRWYASIEGNRGAATRQGTTSSGMHGHIRGWNIGVEVQCSDGPDGEDHVTVWLTGGSNRSARDRLLGTFRRKGQQLVKVK